jgi:hypothetical protein
MLNLNFIIIQRGNVVSAYALLPFSFLATKCLLASSMLLLPQPTFVFWECPFPLSFSPNKGSNFSFIRKAILAFSHSLFLHFHAPFSLASIDYSATMAGEKGRNPETFPFRTKAIMIFNNKAII